MGFRNKYFIIMVVLLAACAKKEGEVANQSNVPELPKVLVDSPKSVEQEDLIEDIHNGEYVLDNVKVQYTSYEKEFDVRFEDFVSLDQESSLYFNEFDRPAEMTWTTYGNLEHDLPNLNLKLPVRFEKENEWLVPDEILNYSAAFVNDQTQQGPVYSWFAAPGERNKSTFDIAKVFFKHLRDDDSQVSMTHDQNIYYSVIQRAPGAFRILIESENKHERVTVNLHYSRNH